MVADARSRYAGTHAEAVWNLARYRWAGMLMTEVISRLMQTYRTSDEMAHLSTDDVLTLFTQAHRDVVTGAPLWSGMRERMQDLWIFKLSPG